MSTPTPRMPLPWMPNHAYADAGDVPPFIVGDRILIAVPLHEDSGGGFDIDVIIVDEVGFNTRHGDNWGDWDWSDVEFYVPLDGERKRSEVE